MSTIEDCTLRRIVGVDLPFDFTDGGCRTFNAIESLPSKIYLCFGSGDYNIGPTPIAMEYGCYYKNADDV